MQMDRLTLIFNESYMQAALMVSLLSVWLLVGLFWYLNHYTRRGYFTVWTTAWLFYALWLTLGLIWPHEAPGSIGFTFRQSCVGISAVFLLWGSLLFLGLPVQQVLLGLFMLFLVVWTTVGPQVSESTLQVQMPVFLLLGCGSIFAGVCFYRLRRRMPFIGAGMLCSGFFLWGLYLASYPLTLEYANLFSAGFFAAAVLLLYLAVSMIVLVLEEVRYKAEEMRIEMEAARSAKEALQARIISTEKECHKLYDEVRLHQGVQQAYNELRQTQQVVVQQERLRALGQMASGVAHDVNNSLSPIVAYSQLLLDTLTDLPETPRHYLETIKQAGEDVSQIITRMREFYRRRQDTQQLTKVDLNECLEQVIELTRPRWRDICQREGISIHILRRFEPKLPCLLSEPTDIREALINLVFNAIDALPQGGTITLVTRLVNRPAADSGGALQREAQVEVRDDGIGMDERTRQRCLEPFFSTKAQRGGSGLGLAMVYGMMQRHKGTMTIESAPHRGTCVRLAFPVQEENLSTEPGPALQARPDRCLHVLCIDDEPQVRGLLKDCLDYLRHRVTVAASGKEGVELFRAAAPTDDPYEVVITDLGMPEMDGCQVAVAIKAESPHTPVILLTGWGTQMKQDGETPPEVDAVVGKPPRLHELNELLLRIVIPRAGAGFGQPPDDWQQQPGSDTSQNAPEAESSLHGAKAKAVVEA